MSRLTTRLLFDVTNVRNFKKYVVRKSFISRVESFNENRLKIGVGVAAMTSVFAFMKDKPQNDDMDIGAVIRNLEEIVEQRACYFYNVHHKSLFFNKKPIMQLDWSDVKYFPEEPEYKKMHNDVKGFRVTSKTVLTNNGKDVQKHKVKSERQTSSVFESYLTEGYTIGPLVGLSFPVPINTNFSASLTLKRVTGNVDKEKTSWVVEDCITVPRKSVIKVSMILKETTEDYKFKSKIGIDGAVKVKFYNKKGIQVADFKIPMHSIILEEFPKRITSFCEDTKRTYITISGRCKCKFETDEIIFDHTPSETWWSFLKKMLKLM